MQWNSDVMDVLKVGKKSDKFDNIRLIDDSNSDGSVADVEDDQADGKESTRRKKRVRRKKIHFRSDFVKDESSSSDEDDSKEKKKFDIQERNPADLNWPLWCWYYTVYVAVGGFRVAEYCGEKLADFFGITSPKYQYVINEYHRLRQEEQEEEEAEEREREYARNQNLERLGQMEGGVATHQKNTIA